MFYTVTLYLAFLIFALGCLYRLWAWLTLRVGDSAQKEIASGRLLSAVKGILSTVLSPAIFTIIVTFSLPIQ